MNGGAITGDQFFFLQFDRTSTSYFSDSAVEDNNIERDHISLNPAFDRSSFSNVDYFESSQAAVRALQKKAEKSTILHMALNKLKEIVAVGDRWIEDGTPGPNAWALEQSMEFARQLAENEVSPSLITQTVEEGVCFVFRNANQSLYLEIYNEKEMGLIVEDFGAKKILSNKNIETHTEAIRELNNFFGR